GTGVGTAKQYILTGSLDVVVPDLEWASRIPCRQGLRVGVDLLEVAGVGVHHRNIRPIHGDAAVVAASRLTVHVAAVEYNVMGERCRRGIPVADRDERIPWHRPTRSEFDADEAEVMAVLNCG